ncbi:MAG: gluconate 2-dehydrogenase subunit 3 family protein [Proteobacteria bacterium]|jgi:gluconate 2-dehydrogenase gamma chain|nr:gluconate 2-dehydrogenase subunit 3 family protein [Pseudomonadota bacterium]MDA0929398.1 gluconate 2-dehydrogenase subunit 3 family protein [Pseudomonadota bacterium]
MKTRREFIQGLIVSVGGATALSACGGLATINATRAGDMGRFYSNNEMALLRRLSDLIIPRTETPGALDANVPGYMDALMSDWANDDTRSEHREALQLIAARLDSATGNFLEADEATAIAALSALDASAFDGNSSLGGYRATKGYITQSYFATEEGAVQELKWVAVPGRWDPSVDIAGEA